MAEPKGRAIAVAELLRAGWTAGEVSAGLKVADAGGSPLEAMQAMEAEKRRNRSPDLVLLDDNEKEAARDA